MALELAKSSVRTARVLRSMAHSRADSLALENALSFARSLAPSAHQKAAPDDRRPSDTGHLLRRGRQIFRHLGRGGPPGGPLKVSPGRAALFLSEN